MIEQKSPKPDPWGPGVRDAGKRIEAKRVDWRLRPPVLFGSFWHQKEQRISISIRTQRTVSNSNP